MDDDKDDDADLDDDNDEGLVEALPRLHRLGNGEYLLSDLGITIRRHKVGPKGRWLWWEVERNGRTMLVQSHQDLRVWLAGLEHVVRRRP